jgi:hypothetical protein
MEENSEVKTNPMWMIAKKSTHVQGRVYSAYLTPVEIVLVCDVSGSLSRELFFEALSKKKKGISGLTSIQFTINDDDIPFFLKYAKRSSDDRQAVQV